MSSPELCNLHLIYSLGLSFPGEMGEFCILHLDLRSVELPFAECKRAVIHVPPRPFLSLHVIIQAPILEGLSCLPFIAFAP